MSFNPTNEQQAIFSHLSNIQNGNLLVTARAGTGKTTTIINGLKFAPETRSGKVLLCAFNKKIAGELSERIGKSFPNVTVKTLHSLGFGAVNAAFRTQLDTFKYIKIVGGWKASTFKGKTYPAVKGIESDDCPRKAVNSAASLCDKIRLMRPTTREEIYDIGLQFGLFLNDKEFGQDWCVDTALKALEIGRSKPQTIDYCDMLDIPLYHDLFVGSFDLVIVDECQDMNAAQIELAERALRPGGRIVVVGDDRQAIYGFAGADSESLNRIRATYSPVELTLTKTFRCPREVVEVANTMVPDLVSGKDAPGEVNHLNGFDDVIDLVSPGDFIISRSNVGAVQSCLKLIRAGIRSGVVGRDIGEGLKKLVEGFKVSSVVDLLNAANEHANKEIEKFSQYKGPNAQKLCEKVNDDLETLVVLCEGLSTVKQVVDRIESLFVEEPNGRVNCMTVHKAKGLESVNVYILSETFKRDGLEEENIRYVAVTRALSTLNFVGTSKMF